jgi:pimeloyl-[acyl-carrier protein] methyl ester esterase
MKIFTETVGQGQDVVLIHGWSHDHRSMAPVKKLLQDHYRVTSVDLPGAGKSDWSDTIKNVHDAADFLLPFLPKKAIYIGWSWGGFVALSIAARYSDRVQRIIGIGTGPRLIEATDWPGLAPPGFKAILSSVTDEEKFKELLIQWYDGEFGNKKENSEIYNQLIAAINEYGPAMNMDVWTKGIYIADETDLRTDYQKITCPLDFIIGTKDAAVVTDWNKMKALNTRMQVHFIDNAQHMPMHTHPKEFSDVLSKILE